MKFNLNYFSDNPVPLETIEQPLPHHKRGLQYTATGYGSKIPTRYKVKYNARWYRVYSKCFSNVSSEYIIVAGKQLPVHD